MTEHLEPYQKPVSPWQCMGCGGHGIICAICRRDIGCACFDQQFVAPQYATCPECGGNGVRPGWTLLPPPNDPARPVTLFWIRMWLVLALAVGLWVAAAILTR